MANRQIDELLSLFAGMAVAKVTRVLTKKYVDTKANLNIASLKRAGIPSNYIHGVAGLGAGGYAVYQANKRGQLSEEEYFAAGFGTMALLDTAGDILSPPTTTTMIQRSPSTQRSPTPSRPPTQSRPPAKKKSFDDFEDDVRILPPQITAFNLEDLAPGEGYARTVL